MEVGSKPEIFAGLSVHTDNESLFVCNGYKDDAFIELEQSTVKKTLLDEAHTLATDPALRHLYKTSPPLKKKPFHLRIVVLNDIYDLVNGSYTEAAVSALVTSVTSDNPLFNYINVMRQWSITGGCTTGSLAKLVLSPAAHVMYSPAPDSRK